MALGRGRGRGERTIDYWPGFVDALSTFLLTIIFLLSVFMLAQYFLSRELTTKDQVLDRLNRQINELSALLALEKGENTRVQGEVNALSASLEQAKQERAANEAALAATRADLSAKGVQAGALSSELDASKRLSSDALSQVEALNQQIAALRRQLAALEETLAIEQTKDKESQTRIADLGRRLNLALAQRVQELSRYRSEFFGKLRDILGARADVKVVGDRFVFPAEVLFPPGSADLSGEGGAELLKIASALQEVGKDIPSDINWVMRVDGHTDKRPIASPQFPSNWELSSARAIAVVRFLIDKGIPANRLVAAGFGEFQPIDPGDSPEALARNRRIELKLTER